ncbi:hypothetical protein L208DRAFT_1400610 [Tricholoma matsutake]|nr:hypothetical protein L208DRAFT_1400610 [Tricholoma matsutake 945]
MAKFTGIKGKVIGTHTAIGQQVEGPPPETGEFTGIEGEIENVTTLTAQVLRSDGQLAEFMKGPGTSSHSAGATSPAITSSEDPSSPSPGNISDVVVALRDLHNGDSHEMLRIVRTGKTLSLLEMVQIQIEYGVFQDIPWSILGFRLKKGEDAKGCAEVRVEGVVKSRDVDIKGIWPPRKPNDLNVFETKHSSGGQFRIGLDSTAKALTSLALTTASEHTSITGQTLVTDFRKQQFEVTLGVKNGSPRGTCVADLVEFFVLVQLSKERNPMTLEVKANVVYRDLVRKKQVQKREVYVYSGEEKYDIRLISVQRA